MSVPHLSRVAIAAMLVIAIALGGYLWWQSQRRILNPNDPAAIAIYDAVIRREIAEMARRHFPPVRVEVFNETCCRFDEFPFSSLLEKLPPALIAPVQPLDETRFPADREYHFISGDRWDLGNLTISLGNVVANDDGTYELLLVSDQGTSLGYTRFRVSRTAGGDWQFEFDDRSGGLWSPLYR